MIINKLRILPTVDLLDLLESVDRDAIEERNMIIYEITCRLYVPFVGVSFEDLLLQNGYQPIEIKRDKTKIK